MDDSAIMLELRTGNMAGFDFLIQKYRKPIIHFMYRMVHNQAVAEELAQEVFLRVYRSRETYRAEARFSTWLYRIATNLGVNFASDNRQERTASLSISIRPTPNQASRPTSPILPPMPNPTCCVTSASTPSVSTSWHSPGAATHGPS